ncbi:hypothetical protein shim_29610 [Shimia sp. SK013]|uniref:DNA polymerase III subunit gamma/tau n=1 Tax=Shimia sp. SK013 TaxID=1389006 RepID=UPI0006B65142|nr:DNA polymerase III subunit gamma/tau [Shimia sp. SK013]KPA21045.1 hypothetical protein shim_29610 [Shimia sp. SK013]
MEFTAREDIDVPIEQVFEMVTDFEVFERSALRRGADVSRLDSLSRAGVGAKWRIAFEFRGKAREVDLEVTGFERPNEIALHGKTQGIESDMKVELVALSRTRTRLQFWSGFTANTLSARLLLQSLKLARGTLNTRLGKRMSNLRRDMEDRYSRMV